MEGLVIAATPFSGLRLNGFLSQRHRHRHRRNDANSGRPGGHCTTFILKSNERSSLPTHTIMNDSKEWKGLVIFAKQSY